MPPVRWKVLAVFAVTIIQHIIATDPIHDTITMTSNGWRPIIKANKDEITQYRNPSPINGNSETVQAITIQTTQPPSSPKPTTTSTTTTSSPPTLPNHIVIHHGGKIAPHSKPHQTVLLVSTHNNHGHGPHIPLNPSNLRGNGPPRLITKVQTHFTSGGKRLVKPMRGQIVGAHSAKNEVFLPAPPGTFTFFNPNHGTIKTRETPNLGPKQHYHITQPHGHIEFISGNVPLPQVPVHTFLLPNRNANPNNDLRFLIPSNDDFTRNLIPPPMFKQSFIEKEKRRDRLPSKPKEQNNLQSNLNKPKENTIQFPPHFGQNSFSSNYQEPHKEQAIEVQVTKEKLNVFHNSIPANYNPIDPFAEQENYQAINKQQLPGFQMPIFNSFPKFDPEEEIKKPATTSTAPNYDENTKRQSFIKYSDQPPNYHTYEVTEEKQWQPFFSTRTPSYQQATRIERPQRLPEYERPPPKYKPQQQLVEYYEQPPRYSDPYIQQPEREPFLPTPYQPETPIPTLPSTLPTQSDVSAIYSEVSYRNKQKVEDFSTFLPSFNIKEVSTHYPIVNLPDIPTQFSSPANAELFPNEITTKEEVKTTVPTQQPTAPDRNNWQAQRTRTNQRRRRPQRVKTTSGTTTETSASTDAYKIRKVPSESVEDSREKPLRRKPSRYRTTQSTPIETTKSENIVRPTVAMRQRNRIRTRPTHPAAIEEVPSNHKSENRDEFLQQTQPDFTGEGASSYESSNVENEVTEAAVTGEEESEQENYEISKSQVSSEEVQEQTVVPPSPAPVENIIKKRIRRPFLDTTTENTATNLLTPENELDYSTPSPSSEEPKNIFAIQEVVEEDKDDETTLATTTLTTTTTTAEPTTTKSHRIRTRPIKYDNKNRPRFSVKDYRQRLTQYTTTTENIKTSTEANTSNRFRFPSKARKTTTTSTTSTPNQEEETTERSKFVPKDARHSVQTEISIIEEKPVKVNTRLRPFNRFRSTTEASTTTQKISIKPHIFSNLRRPPPPSLRTRIMNRNNRTKATTTEKPDEVTDDDGENSDTVETTIQYNSPTDSTTEQSVKKIDRSEEADNVAPGDILKNESFMHSQIVSDLTSSAKKEYNTPGLFKAVSPASRRVPNYFTISTDDPILPIEAFFPNIKDNKEKISKTDTEVEE